MRKLNRVITAGVLSVPMALAIGGIASAEGASFDQHQAVAGPDGVATQQVNSHVKDNGDASYKKSNSSVGPDGSSSEHTSSNTHGKHHSHHQGGDQHGHRSVLGL